MDQSGVESLLSKISDPETGRPLTQTGQVLKIDCSGSNIQIVIGLCSHSAPLWA